MRRWNFKGSGTTRTVRTSTAVTAAPIGTNMTPGRTLPNLKMPGQYGNERVTILNLPVAKVLDEEQILLIEGARARRARTASSPCAAPSRPSREGLSRR